MTDQSEMLLAQLKAREERKAKPKLLPAENIFDGHIAYHRAEIASVPAVCLSVSAAGRPVPQSMAIATVFDWQLCDAQPLPFGIEWQQSARGRWDFAFKISDEARCMGLGERFSGLNIRGRVHTLSTTDETKHTEFADPLYKAIPFLIISDGDDGGQCTGLFLDSPAPQRWDLDSSLSGACSIELLSRRGWNLYVVGPGPVSSIVAAYTELTGRAPLPPLWSLGHQQCRWSYADEETVLNLADEFRQRKIPCDTLVLDIDYMDGYRVFSFSKERFPGFETLAKRLDSMGFKMITIVDPGVKKDQKYGVYQQAIEENLVCKTVEGEPFVADVWPGECVFPDFERPDTRKWWAELHEFYVKAGIAGIWNDMNEPAFFAPTGSLVEEVDELLPTDEHLFVQRAPEGTVGHLEVRNRYALLMCRATAEGLHELRPNERSFVLTRSGYAGVQRYAAVWLGDNYSWWSHLRMSVPMLLNAGLSGLAFCGVDIGGFAGDSSPELLVRWYETGIFYPFFRNHCRMGDRAQEPWTFGPVVERHVRSLIEMRYRLLPYIQSLFWEHARTGAPIMRPLVWHYPNDPLAWETDDQFLFGRDLLVAPISERGKNSRPVYLPAGRWYPIGGGEPLEGGRLHMVHMPLGTVPAFVREGAILPLADPMQNTRAFDKVAVAFTVYGDNAEGTFFEDDGHSLGYRQGEYNEWHLKFANGKLAANAVHKGGKRAERTYAVARGTNKEPFDLQRSS
jgi:alpha-glucosidase